MPPRLHHPHNRWKRIGEWATPIGENRPVLRPGIPCHHNPLHSPLPRSPNHAGQPQPLHEPKRNHQFNGLETSTGIPWAILRPVNSEHRRQQSPRPRSPGGDRSSRRPPTRRRTPEDDRDSRRPYRRDRSPEGSELLDRLQASGITVPYRYDNDIPWDARTIIEDLLFRLDQKANEVSYLQRKVDSAN